LHASPLIELVWHSFMLHTKMYTSFCKDNYIHSTPGKISSDGYAVTLEKYKEAFDQSPPADLWPPI
jgi:hypothetical protein